MLGLLTPLRGVFASEPFAQCFLSVMEHNRCAVCSILQLQDFSEHYDEYALLNIYRKKAGIVKHICDISGAIPIFLPYA